MAPESQADSGADSVALIVVEEEVSRVRRREVSQAARDRASALGVLVGIHPGPKPAQNLCVVSIGRFWGLDNPPAGGRRKIDISQGINTSKSFEWRMLVAEARSAALDGSRAWRPRHTLNAGLRGEVPAW